MVKTELSCRGRLLHLTQWHKLLGLRVTLLVSFFSSLWFMGNVPYKGISILFCIVYFLSELKNLSVGSIWGISNQPFLNAPSVKMMYHSRYFSFYVVSKAGLICWGEFKLCWCFCVDRMRTYTRSFHLTAHLAFLKSVPDSLWSTQWASSNARASTVMINNSTESGASANLDPLCVLFSSEQYFVSRQYNV